VSGLGKGQDVVVERRSADPVRCPWCGNEASKVIDSRPADGGESVRRRRECLACGRRFTTFERAEAPALRVRKRDGSREPYQRAKLVAGVRKAIVNRPVTEEQVERLADRVEDRLRRKGPEVSTQDVGVETLRLLRSLDQVAYLRFASVYKDFQEPSDFQRELGALLQKRVPKRKAARR
jgi:transcriptional repressor NrdR